MRIRPFVRLLSSLSFWFPVLEPVLPVYFQEGFPDHSPAVSCGQYRPLLRWTCHSSASGTTDAAKVAEFLFRSLGGNSLGVRKRYRDLLKIFHPDNLFGDLELAQALSKEFQKRRDG